MLNSNLICILQLSRIFPGPFHLFQPWIFFSFHFPCFLPIFGGIKKACSRFLSLLCISQFQALPSPQATPGQVFKNRQIRALGKFFVSNPRGPGFLGTLDFNKFYTFSPYSRLQSLIYTLNIYKLIYTLNIYKLVGRS